jgi:hypothetical protein
MSSHPTDFTPAQVSSRSSTEVPGGSNFKINLHN